MMTQLIPNALCKRLKFLMLLSSILLFACGEKDAAVATAYSNPLEKEKSLIDIENYAKSKRIPDKPEDRKNRVFKEFQERTAIAEYILNFEMHSDVDLKIKVVENQNRLVIDQYFDKLIASMLSDEQILTYYNEHKERFYIKKINTSQLFLRVTPSNQKEVQEKIKEIMQRYRTEKDFFALIRDYSDLPKNNIEPEIVEVRREEAKPELWQALSTLKQGEISLPVSNTRGITIYKVENISFEEPSYEDIKATVQYQAKEEIRKNEYQRLKKLTEKP
jgi:parvulin-like peptidyl-prolyl isomerase